MTPPACRLDAFRSYRDAAHRAWLLRSQGRAAEPVRCDLCGGFHIAASPRTAAARPDTTGA